MFLGRLVTGLVREFLEFFDLEYSLAVFEPESNFVSTVVVSKHTQLKNQLRDGLYSCYQGDRYQGRDALALELKVNDAVNGSKPIISSLLENHSQAAMPKLDLGSIGEV